MPRLSLPLILAGRGAVIEADSGAAGELAAVLLLEALASAGVEVRIMWAAPGTDPAELLTADWRAIRDERAAIVEYDAGIDRTEAERVAAGAAWDELCPTWFPSQAGNFDPAGGRE